MNRITAVLGTPDFWMMYVYVYICIYVSTYIHIYVYVLRGLYICIYIVYRPSTPYKLLPLYPIEIECVVHPSLEPVIPKLPTRFFFQLQESGRGTSETHSVNLRRVSVSTRCDSQQIRSRKRAALQLINQPTPVSDHGR